MMYRLKLIGNFRWVIVSLLMMAGAYYSFGQIVISGQVMDAEGKPLSRASVTMMKDTSSIANFVYSNDKGEFHKELTSQPYSLCASYLGYSKECIVFDDRERYVFVLEATGFVMKDVVVQEKDYGVRLKRDTTIFKADSFRDSTEFNVEDLLSKLPGITVESSGEIKWYNEPIKLMLIEDSDFLGNQYTIGSRNLRANTVETIEVIENYQVGSVRKNAGKTNETVINLRLKEEYKNVLAGSNIIEAGYNKELKFYHHANLFFISPSVKSLLLSNNTNIGSGYDVFSLFRMFDNTDYNHHHKLYESNLSPVSIQAAGINTSNYVNARQFFNTLRNDFNIGKNSKLQLNSIIQADRDQQFNIQETYTTNDSTVYRNVFSTQTHYKKHIQDHQLKFVHDTEKVFYESNVFYSFIRHRGGYEVSRDDLASRFSPDIDKHSVYVVQKLYLPIHQKINQINEVQYQNINSDERLQALSRDYAPYFGVDTLSGFEQDYHHIRQWLNAYSGVSISGKKLSHEAGLTYNFQAIDGAVDQRLSNPQWGVPSKPSDSYVHTMSLRYMQQYQITSKLNSTITAIGRSYSGNQITYKNGGLISSRTVYKKNASTSVTLFGRYSSSLSGVQQLQNLSMIVDNYAALHQRVQDNLTQHFLVSANYSGGNPFKRKTWGSYLSYSSSRHDYILQTGFDGSTLVLSSLLAPSSSQTQFRVNYSDYFVKTKTSLTVRLNGSLGHGYISLNDHLAPYNTKGGNLNLKLNQYLMRGFILGANYVYGQNSFKYVESQNTAFNTQHRLSMKANWRTPVFQIEANYGTLYNRIDGHNLKPLSDLHLASYISLTPDRSKPIRLTIEAFNLLNNRLQNEIFHQTSSLTYINQIETIGFMFLVGIDHNF